MQVWVKCFANCFDSLNAYIGQGFFELLNNALDTLDVIIAGQIGRDVLEGPFDVIYNRQQVADNSGFDQVFQSGDLFVVAAADVGGVGAFALQSFSQFGDGWFFTHIKFPPGICRPCGLGA